MKSLLTLIQRNIHLGSAFIAAVALPLAVEASWKAGAAAVDITPEVPMWMAGYGGRDRPGDAVGQAIYAKALALEDAGGKVAVIVTLDLLGVPRVLRNAIERAAAERHGIDPHYLLMNASHTHSGPEVRAVETALGSQDRQRQQRVARYRVKLEERILQAISEALANRAPAQIAFSQAKAGFAMNRRMDYALPRNDPRYGTRPNPEGPVDHDVPVLRVTDATGAMKAILFGYACHATTLGEYHFNGDYPGFAQSHLEAAYTGAVALFMAGCGGDQNPHPRRNMVPGLAPFELAEQHGRSLALAVAAALNAHPREIAPSLQSILEDVPLAYLPAPSREELQRRAESSNRTERENAQVLLEWLDRDGRLPTHYQYPIQVMRFGDELTLVALASEVVVDYSLRLKRELAGPGVWVAAYSNDFLGYLPSRRVWNEGGYEGGESMTFGVSTLYRGAAHPNIWAPTVEERIVAKVHELHGRIQDRSLSE